MEDKAGMISIWTIMLEVIKQRKNIVSSGVGGNLTSYMFENIDFKGVVSLSERVGCENLERNVSLRSGVELSKSIFAQ